MIHRALRQPFVLTVAAVLGGCGPAAPTTMTNPPPATAPPMPEAEPPAPPEAEPPAPPEAEPPAPPEGALGPSLDAAPFVKTLG